MRRKLTALLVAAGLAAAIAMPKPAEARCWGCWAGGAFAAGLIGGALISSAAYGYGYPRYGYRPAYYGYQPAYYPAYYGGYGYGPYPPYYRRAYYAPRVRVYYGPRYYAPRYYGPPRYYVRRPYYGPRYFW
jgi:hypothetical protein